MPPLVQPTALRAPSVGGGSLRATLTPSSTCIVGPQATASVRPSLSVPQSQGRISIDRTHVPVGALQALEPHGPVCSSVQPLGPAACCPAQEPAHAAWSAIPAPARSEASYDTAATGSTYLHKDHNSVTIKADTPVKDAAGAIVKVLNRLCSTLVTALSVEATYESANRAVKALAVARKYLQDQGEGCELGFFPVHRDNRPHLYGFLAYKSHLGPGVQLMEGDEADLHVSSNSNSHAMASTVIRVLHDRGQAVLKAGGSNALHVAMDVIISARLQLKQQFASDVLLVPQWITQDTRATLGRESKFIRLNVLPTHLHGVVPALPGASRLYPCIFPVPPAEDEQEQLSSCNMSEAQFA